MSTVSSRLGGRLLDHLRGQREAMVELLVALALAESPSHVAESQADVQKILRGALATRGFRVKHVQGRQTGGQLLAVPAKRTRGRSTQLLLGHCDTVWPIGTLETMPVEVRDGRLLGPGVYDMKAGLVQTLFALQAIQSVSESTELTPVVFINSDEEIGSPESTAPIRRLSQAADRVFVMEPSLGPEGKLKTARKGVGRFVVRVIGRAAHAGLSPEEGASAILELSHVVQKLFALNDPSRGVTVNVGTIDGGLRPNVIAPESSAQVDVRVATSADAAAVENAILALEPSTPGTRLEVTGRIGRPPMERTPGNRKLWELAQLAGDELGIPLQQGAAGGGSDGNSTSQFTPTLDGLGAVGDGAHAITEHVYIDSLVERAALLARLLMFSRLEETREPS